MSVPPSQEHEPWLATTGVSTADGSPPPGHSTPGRALMRKGTQREATTMPHVTLRDFSWIRCETSVFSEIRLGCAGRRAIRPLAVFGRVSRIQTTVPFLPSSG
jgi:hypothetical protein